MAGWLGECVGGGVRVRTGGKESIGESSVEGKKKKKASPVNHVIWVG
jgi:hypothetical protein